MADGASREDRRKSAAPMDPIPFCPPYCRAAELFPRHFHRQCRRCGRIWLALPKSVR